ncbi:hypothetical protein EBR66_08585 [bacterium]|nr:hypothetical protein [bacterium]
MGIGNYRAPGDHYGRLNEMIYVDTTEWGDGDDFMIREDDMYQAIITNLPPSFQQVDRFHRDGNESYYIFAESDTCEVVTEQCENYIAIAFVGKAKKSGWYANWRKTAKKVFRNLHYSGFDLMVRTSAWTSSVWTPKDGFYYMGKKYTGGGYEFSANRNYNETLSGV